MLTWKLIRPYTEKLLHITEGQTIYKALIELGIQKFDSAVANMALMDIADITPLDVKDISKFGWYEIPAVMLLRFRKLI